MGDFSLKRMQLLFRQESDVLQRDFDKTIVREIGDPVDLFVIRRMGPFGTFSVHKAGKCGVKGRDRNEASDLGIGRWRCAPEPDS